MKTFTLRANSVLPFFLSFIIIATTGCQKNLKDNAPANALQTEESVAISTMKGLIVSAADTAAAVNNLYYYYFQDYQNILERSLTSGAKDGNGVLYNHNTKEVFQLSRKNKTLYVFADGNNLLNPLNMVRSFTDTSLSSGREIAYDEANDVLFISNNLDSSIRVYKNFSSLSGNVTGEKVKITGQPWGIIYSARLNKLVVVIDLAAMRLDVFDNPSSLSAGNATASRSINIADRPNGTFSRLHGLTYNEENDVLIVTEIGEAAAPVTPTPGKPAFNADGGIYFIEKGAKRINNGGTVNANTIIYGANTGLGNPVDIATRWVNDKPYVVAAEKANKKLLSFSLNDSGDAIPVRTVLTTYLPEAVDLVK